LHRQLGLGSGSANCSRVGVPPDQRLTEVRQLTADCEALESGDNGMAERHSGRIVFIASDTLWFAHR